MKKALVVLLLLSSTLCLAQINKEQLALDISKADVANTELLKAFIWKRYSAVSVEGEEKATIINEVSFDESGKLQVTQVGGETSVKKKPGIRGRIQENAIEDKMDYVGNALQLSLAYTYMSKGELLDFFEKATVTQEGDVITAIGENVYVQGDKLTVLVDAKTNLYTSKVFTSLLGTDPIDGKITYEKFSSGVNHGSGTVLNLPAQKTVINAVNKDYSQRIK